jgi:hypothetical protein
VVNEVGFGLLFWLDTFLLATYLIESCFILSFVLIQKKQKIKENTIAPQVFPCRRSAKANGWRL